MAFEVPGGRVSTSFPLMQTAALSRAVYADQLARSRDVAAPALPALNAKGLIADTAKITSSPDMRWVKRNAIGISDAYIWPSRTFTVIVGEKGAPKITGQAEVDSLGTADLDLKNPKSLFNYVALRKQTTYLASTTRTREKALYCLNPQTTANVAGLTLQPEGISAAIDISSIFTRVAMHSKSMVLLPLIAEERVYGIMIFTYSRESLFYPAGQGMLGWENIACLKRLADATAVTMMNLHKAGKPLE